MPKKPKREEVKLPQRSKRMELSAAESLKRMEDFPKRVRAVVASIRKHKNRSLMA